MKQIASIAPFTIIALFSYCQGPELVKITRPSPNIQAIQKYGEIPVSPYTGVPNISIPIYTVSFGDISFPISVSYHASGIKVAEEASQVGLGWVLNAGGSVSRNILGSDDWNDYDDVLGSRYFNGENNDLPDFADGKGPISFTQEGCDLDCFSRYTSPTMWTLDMTDYLSANPAFDFEPDQYYFNLPGGSSGKFILKRNKQAVLEKQENLQILPGTDGTTWQIVDSKGLIYEFNIYESNKAYDEAELHMSAWYLTKITSPSGNSITFNYSAPETNYITPIGSWTETRDDFVTPQFLAGGSVHQLPPQSGWTNGKNYTTVFLSSIDFSYGVVQFAYSEDREDLVNDRILDSISIYFKDEQGDISPDPFKTFELTHSYFISSSDPCQGTSATGPNTYRLKLTQIQEKGYYNNPLTANNPYTFDYYEGGTDDLPVKTSFARDHWGYYNGKTGRSSLIPSVRPLNSTNEITYALGIMGTERDASPFFMQAFSLKSIGYPTGGSTEFQYEANTFDEQKSQINDYSYFNNTYSIIQQSASLMYDYSGSNDWPNGNTFDMSNEYADNANNPFEATHLMVAFRFSTTNNCSRIFPYNTLTFDILDESNHVVESKDIANFYTCSGSAINNCMRCGTGVYSYNTDLSLPPGIYHIQLSIDNSSGTYNELEDIHFTFTWYTEVNSGSLSSGAFNYSYGGGLRIAEIIDHDGFNPAKDRVTKYIYHYKEDRNNDGTLEEYSYGRRMSSPHYAYFSATKEAFRLHCPPPPDIDGIQFGAHLMRSSDSNNPLNGSAQGCVVGYDTVVVLYGENGENGKTVYAYYNNPDFVYSYNDPHTVLPMRPPYASNIQDPLNGDLIYQCDFANNKGTFKKLREVTNDYATTFLSTAPDENVVFGTQIIPYTTNVMLITCGEPTSTSPQISGPCDFYTLTYRTLNSEWSYLSGTVTKTYDQVDTSKYIESSVQYEYDIKDKQPVKITSNNSKGELVITNLKYPLDYSLSGTITDDIALGIQNLQNNNIVDPVIEKYIQKSNADGSELRTISSVFTAYKPTTPYPDIIYQLENSQALTDFTPVSVDESNTTMNDYYQSKIYFDSYDDFGNILQQHKANDVNHSYIWDYYSSLPVTEVINASQSDIAYSSFEADGTGNFDFSGTIITNEIPPTGKNCYDLESGSIEKTGLDDGKTYIVSYWTKNGDYSVSGTVNEKEGKTIGDWTYYEHIVTGETTIEISGNGYIDELRLYPANAQMVTYTYEPLIGMTSQCDVNNRVSYYEYDGLGRLRLIRDQDKNILKKICYNYAGQEVNCDPNP